MGDHLKSNVAVHESCFASENHKNNPFPNVPGGLCVGFHPKGSEMDSIRSPTSPLDFRVFSSFGNPYRSSRASFKEVRHKTLDRPKVGLGIINSLDDETNLTGKVLQSRPLMMIKAQNIGYHIDSIQAPKSLPKDIAIFPGPKAKPTNLQKHKSNVLFEIGESPFPDEDSKSTIRSCSLDSAWSGPRLINIGNRKSRLSTGNFRSGNQTCTLDLPVQSIKQGFPGNQIELSEDYTCVRTHGPNPKVTHIFGDCVLECPSNELRNFSSNNVELTALPQADILSKYPSDDFLSFCYYCKKKLEGEDIYMYRGEKAFCSSDCRSQELWIDEMSEKNNCDDDVSEKNSNLNSRDDLFESGTLTIM